MMLMWLVFRAEPAFLQSVIDKGERLRSGLSEALEGNEHVKEIRGLGLITGIQLDQVPSNTLTEATQLCLTSLLYLPWIPC